LVLLTLGRIFKPKPRRNLDASVAYGNPGKATPNFLNIGALQTGNYGL
jgi:hypothetical protein